MVKISCKIKGLNSLNEKINTIIKGLLQIMK